MICNTSCWDLMKLLPPDSLPDAWRRERRSLISKSQRGGWRAWEPANPLVFLVSVLISGFWFSGGLEVGSPNLTH